jgi:hypothetical protein
MRCSRIKHNDDRLSVSEECTREYFFTIRNLLNCGVVGVASPWCWAPRLAPLLVHCGRQSSGLIPLLGGTAIPVKVTNLPVVEARVGEGRCGLLRCPRRCRLLRVGDGTGVRLLLMLLVLWAMAPLWRWRTTWLSCWRSMDQMVLRWSTSRTTSRRS